MTALARHTVRAARLVATLATTAGSHAARTVETVVSTVTSFATGTADDLAALAMRID